MKLTEKKAKYRQNHLPAYSRARRLKPLAAFATRLLCLLTTQVVFSVGMAIAQTGVLLPDEVAPIQQTPPELPANKNRLKQRTNKKNLKQEVKPTPAEIRDSALADLTSRPLSRNYILGINWLIPTIWTSGPRKDYKLDPTTHFYGYANLSAEGQKLNYMLGFRTASFAGSGVYNGIPGQFGLLYFGPSLGISYPSDETSESNSSTAEHAKNTSKKLHFFHCGVSLQTRRAGELTNEAVADDDLTTTQGVNFDSPGLWVEYQYQSIYFASMGYGVVLGSQIGDGKVFAWLGVSTVGWL